MPHTEHCFHFLPDLMPEYGGSLVYVVSGLVPADDTQQCPTGEHGDVEGGHRVTIPASRITSEKRARGIGQCRSCEETGRYVCVCNGCGCCLAALPWVLDDIRELHGLQREYTGEAIGKP